MIANNILKVVEDPTDWVSQMTTVEKPDGSIRICLDPIPLNRALKREHFKLPTLEDILPKLHGARLFCKIDVAQAYLHVPVRNVQCQPQPNSVPFGAGHQNTTRGLVNIR